MEKYKKYLGIPHDFQNINCITLISKIYEQELSRQDFKKVWGYVDVKNGHPDPAYQNKWWKYLIQEKLLICLQECATRVEKLIDLKEYDVIIFGTPRKNIPIHFGMYIGQNSIIHLPAGSTSKIELLNDYWRGRIHSVHRRKMV